MVVGAAAYVASVRGGGADGRSSREGATARRALTPDDGRRRGRVSSSAEAAGGENNYGGQKHFSVFENTFLFLPLAIIFMHVLSVDTHTKNQRIS